MIRQLKVNILKDFGPYKKGKCIVVPCNDEGTPKSAYWRARLKDAKIDNCCSILAFDIKEVSETVVAKSTKAKKKQGAKAKLDGASIKASTKKPCNITSTKSEVTK